MASKLDELRPIDFDGKLSTYLVSLEKLCGHKVVDLHGYLSREFDEPIFKLCVAIMDDGTRVHIEGEHDFPYLQDVPGVSDERLEELCAEDDE